jgi:predicted TIM-barrel fold metal-dependent hydrolase
MLNGTTVIDADGHLNDWHLDWESLLPDDLGPGATRSVRDEHGFPHLQVEGRLLPGGDRDELDYHDIQTVMKQMTRDGRYWLPMRPGEEDPVQRLPDMDEMGIDVAVLFGGHCLLVASCVESPEIAAATLAAYNDYLAGYCATDPNRLKGVAMIPMQAPKVAADELRRAVKELGLVAGVLPPHHKNGTMLDDRTLDPIWDAAEELDVPICIHTIGMQINPANALVHGEIMGETYGGFPSMLALGSLVLGGVLERHPNLRVAFLEAGAGWVPYVMERMQSSYSTFSMKDSKLRRDPEDYIRGGQVYIATEPDEDVLPVVAELIGEDHLVLGSDYCHPEGMCPFTMKALAERDDLSEGLKKKILHENPARLYGLS